MDAKPTVPERLLWWTLLALVVVFVGSITAYLIDGLDGGGKFPFVANSVTKDGLFLAITVFALADIRRFGWMTLLVIYGHVLLIISLGIMLLTGNASDASLLPFGGSATDGEGSALIWLGLDVLVVALLSVFYILAQRSRPDLRYLSPLQLATVRALSEVLVPDRHRRLDPERIARNADNYLGAFHAKSKWKVKVALLPLALLALISLRQRKRFVESQLRSDGTWVLGRLLRKATQPLLGVAAQLVYLAYYGDRETFESIGYKRFQDRDDYAERMARDAPVIRSPLKAMDPNRLSPDDLVADVVIVGSGAAGAIIAYDLAESGKDVLVLERGMHVEPARFNDTETDMLSKLYSDGAIQVSRDLRFAVLQGMCVGGSTVVNNAVCIPAPDDVLDMWNDPRGLNAGLDRARLDQSFEHIRRFLRIDSQPEHVFGNNARAFLAGTAALGLEDDMNVVEANIQRCLGCGYCNIGCAFDRKLSMLDKVLPEAQAKFRDKAKDRDRVRVLPECEAQRIEMAGTHAEAVRCKVGEKGRTVRVRARERYVVSAGAINSSVLLQRSRIRPSAVGRGLSFNMATPLTALFERDMCSYDGLQISHYLRPPDDPGYVIETWFNPPAMQSLFMPGWGERHYQNMSDYAHMACAGVVVGTQSNGNVRRGLMSNFGFEPRREDLEKLIKGVKQLGEIFFAAGATKVMPSTLRYEEFRPDDDLRRLDHYIDHRTGISLNSAHPQGGNAICKDPSRGVVDPSFRVHGLDNVHVCDASVFPSSITVNPQWTVMALAHYAAGEIGEAVTKRPRRGPRRFRRRPDAAPVSKPPPAPVGAPEDRP
jgi:choline dehydrogenase-like flavoprotein